MALKSSGDQLNGAFAPSLISKQEDMLTDGSNTTVHSTSHEMQPLLPQVVEELTSNQLVCLNVGGKKFYAIRQNFQRFPATRLGRLIHANTRNLILELCDRFTEGNVPEFFFDRSWKGFNDILDVYRVGKLHLNSAGLCAMRTKSLLEYWQIDEFLLDPCCALRYYPEIEACQEEIEGQLETERRYQERLVTENFGPTKLGRIRKYLWNLTEYPETSVAARITAFTSMSVVVISTITFVLSTMPQLTDTIDILLFENGTEVSNMTEGRAMTEERWHTGILALKIIDEFTMWFFTIEYFTRLACSPLKWEFFKAPLNLVDLLAILPYFVSFIMEEMKDTLAIGRAGKVLRLIRVMRILRVFKLVRHFNGLQSLLSTLKQAYKELGLLMVLVMVTVLTFSSLIYFAEKDSENRWSFFDCLWWGLMVLTTVGYGAQQPATAVGQAIGGFCALIGIFILAMPVPIVVNSFALNYKNRIWRNEVTARKQELATKNISTTALDSAQDVKPEEGLCPIKRCNGDASTTVESFVSIS